MNTETPSLQLLRTQYGQANIVQQKSQLVAFYLKNYIITKTIDFLKSERSQGKDISEMTADVHNWFQDLEGVKQSLGSQLQDMDTCRQQFFDFTYYHFSRCDAQYKNNVRSQQLADELASVLLLTEAYSIFNAPDQQVDHMRNVARTAYTEVLKNAQTNPKFQPTYSTYSQPSNQGIMYHGNELETPNPDMNNTAASIRQGPSQGQSIANQNQLHSIKTPGGPTTGVSALSGFQMVESSFVSKDTLTQNRSQATHMQSQHQNLQSQNRPGLQSQAYQNPNQSIRAPGNQNAPFSGFQPVQSVVVTQGSLNQQQAAAQDKELTHFDNLLASLQPGNIQASQYRQSQLQGQAGHGLSGYQAGQSINQPGTNDNNQGAFSGFNMAESNYVPQQSIGQNQQGQAGPLGFQGVQSIRQTGPNNNNQGAFSGFNMAESNYVSRDAISNRSQQQGGPGGFPQNVQGYNQSQQSHPNRMEVEGPGVPFGQGVLRSQAYNPNAGNFNNNALPDFTRMQNDPTNIPNRDGTSQSNAPYQPFDFKQSSHPNQPCPGLIPGSGQQNFLGQNAGIQGNREEPFAQENKKDISKALPSRQGGGANTGPALNLPNDKYNILKELCRMTISELDYKNVKEAKDNIRKALSIIREHNPGM